MQGCCTVPTVATDPQHREAGTKGGHAEPTSESRRAQLRRGRHTNSRLNRRHVRQAYVGYRLGPKWTWRNERTPPLRLDNSLLDPGCIPQVSRRTVRPYAQRQTEPRNGVTPPPALHWHGTRVETNGAGVNRKRKRRGIVSQAKAHGKAMG